MLFPGVKKLGKSLGLSRSDSVVMGNVENGYVRLCDGMNKKVLEFVFPRVDDDGKNEINLFLKNGKIKKNEWSGNTLVVTFPEYLAPYPIKKIRDVISYLGEYARDHYPDGKVACQKCEASTDAASYSLGDASLYLCGDCVGNMELEQQNRKHEYEAIPANYLSGTAGALLFALPGMIVTAVLFVFLDSIAALSAVVYVYLGAKGYSRFKGKTDKVGAAILTVSGLVFSCAGIAVSYFAMILYKTKSLEYTRELLKNPEIQKELGMNVILAMIVCSFYLASNFISLLGEWKFPVLKKTREI